MTADPAAALSVELLTPPGPGGIAVVAVRGEGRCAALRGVLRRASDGAPLDFTRPAPCLARLGRGETAVDRVLVVARRDWIEIHTHASEAVLAWLAREVGNPRAPELSPAESLVATAVSEAQLALGLEQQGFDWSGFVAELESSSPEVRRRRALAALRRSDVALALREPARLVLCGSQNAGKSTLMNRLLFRERALAGAHPGLTRDPIRELTELGGYPYLVVDTAGEGSTATEIDRLAVERGRGERALGICVAVVDGTRPPDRIARELSRVARLWIRNKSDLPLCAWPAELAPVVTLSGLSPADAPFVRAKVGERLRLLRGLPPAGPVGGPAALHPRQRAQLMALL